MSEKFVILHLSDAHLGNPKYANDLLNVFDPLFEDLKTSYQEEKLKPTLIVFSGDLAFGDIPEKKIKDQYVAAKDFLEKVTLCFKATYGEIPILIVPGNHDIDRNLISDGDKLLRATFTEERVNELMFRNDITWKRILERQKEWFAFVNTIPKHHWKWNAELHMATGIIEHQGKKIGIAGLNSSWASHEEKETGLLWIGKRQYDSAYNEIRNTDFKIAVAHHPVDWLHQEDKKTIGQKIETQFQIFLHGHEHEPWFTSSDGHLKCLAGACYNGSKERNGFSWLVIDTDSSDVTIHLREYTAQGKGGWRANHIPDKTNEKGVSCVSLVKKVVQTEKATAVAQQKHAMPVPAATKFPDNLEDFIRILEDRFNFRWESANTIQSSTKPLIYWPVRLRQPTPIHASQCFVAAGLQKLGCRISLWTDDLGTPDYSYDVFIQKLKDWYARAGGDESQIERRQFSEILTHHQHREPAWTMLQKWLGTMAYFTDQILKISKIWPSTEESAKEEPENILKEFSKRRPRRLMTPSMVWTCLLVLHGESPPLPIITLGGYDEQELWDAWRKCCGFPDMQVGHLYVSKLTQRKNDVEHAIHMEVNRLAWTSKEDIEEEFRKSLAEIDSPQTWSNVRSMIPWTINNCVLLPAFVDNKAGAVNIGGNIIGKLDDLKHFTPSVVLDDLVGATNKWLF